MIRGGFVALFVVVAAACTGSDPASAVTPPGPLDGAGGQAEAGAPTPIVIAELATLAVSPGKAIPMKVSIARNGFAGVVHLSVTGNPTTVQIPPIDIPADASDGSFTVAAASEAITARSTLAITASGDGLRATSRNVELVVRGTPGTIDTAVSNDGTPFASTGKGAAGVGVDGLGRIWVASEDCVLTRHLASGKIDADFQPRQLFPTDPLFGAPSPASVRCQTLAVHGSMIAVGGRVGDGTSGSVFVARWSTDGTLVSTPTTLYRATDASAFTAKKIQIESESVLRVIVEGTDPSHQALDVVDGSGRLTNAPVTMTLAADGGRYWAFLPDGGARVVATKTGTESGGLTPRLVDGGFTKDGSLDPAFGATGSKVDQGAGILAKGDKTVNAVAIAPNGDTLAIGQYTDAINSLAFVAGHTPQSPTWDLPYGRRAGEDPMTGMAFEDARGQDATFATALVDANGGTLCPGRTTSATFAARFDAAGTAVSTFGNAGIAKYPPRPSVVRDAVLQDDAAALVFVDPTTAEISLLRIWL